MTPFERQLAVLKELHPAAASERLPDGSFAVVVPDLPLPEGWTAKTATVRFIAPVGYPQSRPDCFWTDPQLRLAAGQVPQNTGSNAMPHGPAPLLWFSWHVQTWSPNADTLTTFLNVIRKRFAELR